MKNLLLLFVSIVLFLPVYAQDTLYATVHVIYGSKPKAPGETSWFGGKLGGHVGLEIAPDRVIHFNPAGQVKAFRRKSSPGNFVESTVEGFYCTFGCDTVKTLQVHIPITTAGSDSLAVISNRFLEQAPYPYAFFGMRCAAACYHLLSVASVFPEKSEGKMLRRFFYPRRLRKFVLKEAKRQHWTVIQTQGTQRRKWDHD